MKSRSLCPMLSLALLLSLSALAFAHSGADADGPSNAQKSFDKLKTLAGTWQGRATIDPPQPDMKPGNLTQISIRVTSRGNALVHEMQEAGTPLDPANYDHPLTMFYLDANRLTLVHYCDAGNRPRMVARSSADDKTIEFDFVDLSGANDYGHMYHAVFTFIDANHHTEDWTFMMPGNKPVHGHLDLVRSK